MKTLLQAQWLASMAGPLLPEGAVVFEDGRIVSAGQAPCLKKQHPDAAIDDAGTSIILPGLVNAHAHLELSNCQCGRAPTGGFVGWLKTMVARSSLDPPALAAAVEKSVTIGVDQCLRFGVTTVGDISRQCQLTRLLLARSPLRVVSFGEIRAMARRRSLLEERLAAAADSTSASNHLWIGLSPHAPYSVEPAAYCRCLEIARQRNLRLATHLAETPDEAIFLADHSGPFRELWEFLQSWDDKVPRFQGGPIRLAQATGLLDFPTVLAHVNYCDDQELSILARGQASVVCNPRTHRYFGHPPHRWRDMLACGINIAVGTDSCASSPDLNLVDELRLLHEIAPDFPPQHLWELATIRAAHALSLEDRLGSISPGKSADFVVFPAAGPNPLAHILENHDLPLQVWIAGHRQLPPVFLAR